MYFMSPLSMLQQALVSMPGGAPAPAAPTYYGPMHQALAKAFGQSVMQQARAPQTIAAMLAYPNFLPSENGGFNIRNTIAPQPNNDWRIDWFKEDREKAAAAAAAAAAQAPQAQATQQSGIGPSGLLDAWGVRAGQNDVPGGV